MLAGLFPVLFIPTLTDAYVLPRAALAVTGACLLVGWGLATVRPGLGSLGLPAAAVVLCALLATAFSVRPSLSLVGSYARYESVATRLAYIGLFVGGAWLARSPASREWTLTAFLAGCAVASLEAVHEVLTGFPPRPDGNLGQANLLGALLAMAVPIAAGRAVRRPAWALLLVLLGTGLALSSSRSGWLGALAGSLVVIGLSARGNRLRFVVLACALAAIGVALLMIAVGPLSALNGDTGVARLHVWRDSLPLIAARPLVGYGEDTLGLVLGPHLTGNWEPGVTFDRIHQNELDLLAAQGVLGLAACSWFFGVWLVGCVRRLRTPEGEPDSTLVATVGAWSAYLVFAQLNFDWVGATAPLWLLVGVAWAATVPAQVPAASRRWLALWVPLAATGITFGILPLVADARAAGANAAAAVRLDPLQPQYHRLLGEASLKDGENGLRIARDQLSQARDLGAYDAIAFIELGDVQAALGDRAGALAAYRGGLTLDPFNVTARQRLNDLGS